MPDETDHTPLLMASVRILPSKPHSVVGASVQSGQMPTPEAPESCSRRWGWGVVGEKKVNDLAPILGDVAIACPLLLQTIEVFS